MKFSKSVSAALLAAITACPALAQFAVSHTSSGVQGSGKAISETRHLKGTYHSLNISVPAAVNFTINAKSTLTVMGDDNIVKLIDSTIENGVLIIKSEKFDRPKNKVLLTIANPDLKTVNLAGATNINLSGLKGGNLEISASGANRVVGSGFVDGLKVDLKGAGDLNLQDLKAKAATVNISGTGDVSVNCSKSLQVSITGMGNVRYAGKPAQVQQKVAGMGKVTPL